MSTNREDWAALLALLDTALELDEPARQPWLQALPEPRRSRLRELLASRSAIETDNFLARPASLPAAGASAVSGQRLGPWRLLHELGSGGMAWVWLAERADGQGTRRVALKLPRLGWAPGLAERMARERDILATLAHPHIARLYDAGVDKQGRPWLALEHVQGQPIDEHARERSLSVPQRVELLLQVADAVAYAHQRLIIHRDLKPSNILVTAQGQVQLLDFGIAKLVQGDRSQATGLTLASGRALTPDYASPEQVLAQPLGTSSDVYSLGVVAYELLAGVRPYKLKRGTAAELEEAILQADIAAPSTVAPNPEVRRALQGDLDAVVLMALKQRPSERYASVEAFAADLQRALRNEPVRAQRDSAWYRLKKLVLRHKLESGVLLAVLIAVPAGAGAQVAVMVALTLGAGATLWQARKAQAAAAAARREAERAELVKRASLALFEDADSDAGAGQETRAVDLLKAAAQRLQTDATMPALVRAELQVAVAYSLLGLGSVEPALGLAQSALEAIRRAGADGPLRMDALTVVGEALNDSGRSDEAAEVLGQAQAAARAAGDVEREVRATCRFSNALINQGQAALAVERCEEALALCEQHPDQVSTLWRCHVAGSLANARKSAGQPFLAAAQLALDWARRHYGDRMTLTVLEKRLFVAAAIVNEADARQGVAQLRELVVAMARTCGPTHPHVSVAYTWLALAEFDTGHPTAALEALQQAASILRGNEGERSCNVALAHLRMGHAHLRAWRPLHALPELQLALDITAESAGEQHPQWRLARCQTALALARSGQHEAAAPLANVADPQAAVTPTSMQERLWAAECAARAGQAVDPPASWGSDLQQVLHQLPPLKAAILRAQASTVALAAGDAPWALQACQDAWQALAPVHDDSSPDLAELAALRGQCQQALGDAPTASASWAEAQRRWRLFDPGHPRIDQIQVFIESSLAAHAAAATRLSPPP